jgi:hypothetical protein
MSAVVFGRPRTFSLIALVLVCTLATACGGSKKDASPAGTPVNAKSTLARLAIGPVSVESIGPDVKIPKSTQKKILEAAQKYVNTAVVAPLDTGKADPAFGSLFDTGIRGHATSVDSGVLTDNGIGKASSYDQAASPLRLMGLADGSGRFLYLAVSFFESVNAKTDAGAVTSGRDVELTYAPSGKDWLVTAYRVKTMRKLPSGATTTTTADAGGTKP